MKVIEKTKFYFIFSLIILGLIGLDQLTKFLATLYLPRQYDTFYEMPITVIPKFFYLVEHRNTGAAWSILEDQRMILLILPLLALGLFIYLLRQGNLDNKKVYSIGLALMIAGTIGNFIDRLFYGYVVDFLAFHFGSYQFPVFNFADSCLTIGVVLFSFDIIFLEQKRNKVFDDKS